MPPGARSWSSPRTSRPRGPPGRGASRINAIDADLPAGDQGAQRGRGGSRPRTTTFAGRPPGTRRGGGDRRARARVPESVWWTARREPPTSRSRDPSKGEVAMHSCCRWTGRVETVPPLRGRFPGRSSTRQATISATRPRTARPRSRSSRSQAQTWSSSWARRTPRDSVRLVEVVQDHGAPATYLVDDEAEVDESWLNGVTTVGVTSRASEPEELVASVLGKLADCGFDSGVEVSRLSIAAELPRPCRRLRSPGLRRPRS